MTAFEMMLLHFPNTAISGMVYNLITCRRVCNCYYYCIQQYCINAKPLYEFLLYTEVFMHSNSYIPPPLPPILIS